MARRNPSHVARRLRTVEPLESRCMLTAGLLADVNDYGSYPAQLATVAGWTYFRVQEASGGYALERTDGSGSPPQVVERFALRTDFDTPERPQGFVPFGGSVYQIVGAGSYRQSRMEKLDPVTGTVTTAMPLGPAVGYGTQAGNLTVVNDQRMVFTDGMGTGNMTLYGTDGTAGGTVLLAQNLFPVVQFEHLGSSIVFMEATAANSYSGTLWITDGTVAGTRRLTVDDNAVIAFNASGDKILYSTYNHTFGTPGSTSSVASVDASGAKQILVSNLAVTMLGGSADGIGYFSTAVAGGPNDLYITDGTTAGTRFVTTTPGPMMLEVRAVVGDKAFMTAYEASTGKQKGVWISDGTAAGTFSLTPSDMTDVGVAPPGLDDPDLPILVTVGNQAFFEGSVPSQGLELWTSDGTVAGTHAVSDLIPGPEGSVPLGLTPTPQGVLFVAHNAEHQPGVYLAAPDGSGITSLAQIDSGQTGPSAPTNPVTINGRTYFSALSDMNNNTLWVTDGTPAGTYSITALVPALAGQRSVPIGTVGNNLLFSVGNYNFTYWETDGTAANTFSVGNTIPADADLSQQSKPSDPRMTTVIGPQTFSVVKHPDGSETLQVADPSGNVTALKAFPNGNIDEFPRDGLAFEGKFYYLIPNGPDRGLYVSDGTVAGTKAVNRPTTTTLDGLAVVGGQLTFMVRRDPHDFRLPPGLVGGDYLFASNGTSWGTYLVSRLGPYTLPNYTYDMAVNELSNGQLLVFGNDGLHGTEPMIVTPDYPAPSPPDDTGVKIIYLHDSSVPSPSIPASFSRAPFAAADTAAPPKPVPAAVLSPVTSLVSAVTTAVPAVLTLSDPVVRRSPGPRQTFHERSIPIRSATSDPSGQRTTLNFRSHVARDSRSSLVITAPGLRDLRAGSTRPNGGILKSFHSRGLRRFAIDSQG